MLIRRGKIYFKDEKDLAYCKAMQLKHKLSYSNIYRLGIEALVSDVSNVSMLQYDSAYAEAFIYFKETQGKKMIPWKVLASRGRKQNISAIRIYKIEELERDKVLIIYSDENTEEGKYHSLRKMTKHVDKSVLKKFFPSKEFA